MVENAAGVTLTTGTGHLRLDAVVAADGDPSGIARRLGLGGSAARHALALEVDLPLSSELPADTAVLTFGVRGGYAWYFPKGDHANVGAGSYRETAPTALKEVLARFARSVAAGPQAWVLSSSYSRAIQDSVLEAWRGRAANAPAAQDAIARRARLNGLARMGQYQPEATSWDGRPRRAAPSAQHSQGEAR